MVRVKPKMTAAPRARP